MTAILEPPTTTPAPPARLDRPALLEAPVEPAPAPPAPPRRPRVERDLDPRGVRAIGAVLLGLFTVGVLIQPAPTGPDPVLPGWVGVLDVAVTVALLASLAGFTLGRRWALSAGAALGGSLLTASLLCPALDHHVLAGWWFGQVAIGAAMLAVPLAALVGTRGPGRGSSGS